MQQKLSEPDTDGSGIHMNEIVAYLNSAYGVSGLNDDALFNSKDILLVLDQIGLLLAR